MWVASKIILAHTATDSETDWALHRDYFCERWHCTRREAESVLEEMISRQWQEAVSICGNSINPCRSSPILSV